MNVQKKVKFLISIAMLIIVALSAVVVMQIIKINKANKQITAQQEQIYQFEKQLDSYSKLPGDDYEKIS